MELSESTNLDMSSNRRGRPRSFEQARKGLITAETMKSYASLIPMLMESGLYGLLFINLYRFFRGSTISTTMQAVKNWLEDFNDAGEKVLGISGAAKLLYGINTQHTHEARRIRWKENIRITKLNMLVELLIPEGYENLIPPSQNVNQATLLINEFMEHMKNQRRRMEILMEWQKKMNAFDANPSSQIPPKEVDSMSWIEAAGWAAFCIILLKEGISLGGKLAQAAFVR